MAAISFDLTDEWADKACPTPAVPAEFDSAAARIASDSAPFDGVIAVEDMRAEEDAIKKMCELTVSAEGEYLAAVSARLKLLLLKVAETTDENALPERMVEALGEYIRENVGEDISNTELGAIFGYHPFYISNVLKAAKGMTLKQYITKYRLDLAKRMLEAGSGSIAEIADACGFTDASYFTKTFRQATGVTPKEYRNKFKEEFI
jgi:AraC-like DNA-binding protein